MKEEECKHLKVKSISQKIITQWECLVCGKKYEKISSEPKTEEGFIITKLKGEKAKVSLYMKSPEEKLNLENLIEEKIEEFRERFFDNQDSFERYDREDCYVYFNDTACFLRQSLTSIAKEALEAVRLEKKDEPMEGRTTYDYLDSGYNMAVSALNNNINKFLNL